MKKNSILIVEDEKTMREALEESFEKEGFEVETASDGEDAINKIKENKFDLVLLDLILPKKDGFDVLKEIKNSSGAENLLVVLCTNLSDMQDIQKAIDLGAKTYLLKADYSLADIVSKVKRLLIEK